MAEKEQDFELSEKDLRHWRLLERFRSALAKAQESGPQHSSFAHPNRELQAEDYLSLFLFGLFNPAIRTMRGLCQASRWTRVQEEVCSRAISLGSFSEVQHLLDPACLERVFNQLAQQTAGRVNDPRLGPWQWLARDGSLFAAMPKMHWALYGAGKMGLPNNAVRLHLSLNLLEDKPQVAAVRVGKVCERKVWKEQWKAGQAYVGDRLYGEDYKIFGQLTEKGCAYVLRIKEEAVIKVEEEIALSQADRQAGVIRQGWAYLGSTARYRSVRVRVVWIATQAGNPLILVTNLAPEQLEASLVSMLYRWRWKVELFFRWIKCILKCGHWLAQSPRGTAIQIYLSLIAALLLQFRMGQRPNRRLMEMIQMHQSGWVTDEELTAALEKHKAEQAKKHKA